MVINSKLYLLEVYVKFVYVSYLNNCKKNDFITTCNSSNLKLVLEYEQKNKHFKVIISFR